MHEENSPMAASNEDSVKNSLRPLVTTGLPALSKQWSLGLPCNDLEAARAGLRETIENEIIPRLVLSHPAGGDARNDSALSEECLAAAVIEIADCAEDQELGAARAVVDRLLQRGLPVETCFLRVLGDAARLLGRRWELDQADFLQVTLGIGCLQALLRDLAAVHEDGMAGCASDRRVLVVPTPGESHGFGTAMVAEIFRRHGWNVDSEPAETSALLAERAAGEWFDVVCLSLSTETLLPQLADVIRHIRQAARNRRIGIMVGGPLFALHPDWISRVGADACGQDALQAVQRAEQLVGLLVNMR
jgi:methanogenic corrinoid protein MtbC1